MRQNKASVFPHFILLCNILCSFMVLHLQLKILAYIFVNLFGQILLKSCLIDHCFSSISRVYSYQYLLLFHLQIDIHLSLSPTIQILFRLILLKTILSVASLLLTRGRSLSSVSNVIMYVYQNFGVREVHGQIPKSIYQASCLLPTDFPNSFS